MELSKCWRMVKLSKPKISMKMKHRKTFYEAQTASRIWEVIAPLPHPCHQPDKILLRLCNKNSIMEMYRNMHTFIFKVLEECSSWASRNDAVQMFYLAPKSKMLAGKFVKWERFLVALWKHDIFNVKLVDILKMRGGFRANLYCKMSELCRSFLLALRHSARKLKKWRKLR